MTRQMTERKLYVTMPDGSEWAVKVTDIVANRAAYYHVHHKDEFPTLAAAMLETEELFKDDYEVADWAASNMNWGDVADRAEFVSPPPQLSSEGFQEGWVNGDKRVI